MPVRKMLRSVLKSARNPSRPHQLEQSVASRGAPASRQRPNLALATAAGITGLVLSLTHCANSDSNDAASSGGTGTLGNTGQSGTFGVGGGSSQGKAGSPSGGAAAGTGSAGGCTADSDCGSGRICEVSLCQMAQCQTDADCGATQSCQAQRCAAVTCTPPAIPISLSAAPGTLAVGLIGTFNSWSTGAATAAPWLLAMGSDDWSGSFTLPTGANSYKFFVESATTCSADADAGVSGTCVASDTCLNGHCWSYVSDPSNIDTAPDGFGGLNAIITMSCTGIVPFVPTATGEGGAGGDTGGCAAPAIQFTYTDSQATSVAVFGSFEGWSPALATPLVKADAGKWSASVEIPPGSYQYKFIVDGTNYIPDPEDTDNVPDGFGNQNSVLTVACNGRVVPGAGGAGGNDVQ